MTENDTHQNPRPLSTATVLAFARELRRLAAQVERDLRRNEPVAALSGLAAIKPLTGVLTDSTLSGVMSHESVEDNEPTHSPDNPLGYL